MATTLNHRSCPAGTLATWRGAGKEGFSVPVYVRESYVETVDMVTYSREEARRRWVRVGTICMDCKAFVYGAARVADGPGAVDQLDRAGIPLELASSAGIPSRSS